MPNLQILRLLRLPLAARTHVVLLFALAYFVVCANTDGGLSLRELLCGAGLAALLQLGYLVNKFYDRAEDAFNGEPEVFRAYGAAPRVLLGTAFAGVCALLFLLSPSLLWILVYSAAVTAAYSHPALRLKGLPLVKPLVNTLNFFMVSFMAPMLVRDPGAWGYLQHLLAPSWRMLLAVLSLTLMFDVRDMRGDAMAGIRTIPALTGRIPLLAVIAGLAFFLFGVDILAGVYLSAANQLILGGFALGAFRERGRGYYDLLVLAELIFLGVMLAASWR